MYVTAITAAGGERRAALGDRGVAGRLSTRPSTACWRRPRDAGAHGIVGVVDIDVPSDRRRDPGVPPATGPRWSSREPSHRLQIWTSYLAGQRLAKLLEAGFLPVSIAASMASVRIWAVCSTEILLRGGYDQWGIVAPGDEIRQLSDAHMEARRRARDHIRNVLQGGVLHGAEVQVAEHEIGEGDREVVCTIRGNAVQKVKDAAALPAPLPTVRLS